MPNHPRYSVLLPSRNRLDLLRLAVDSVLRQSYASVELVISDNASEENYAEFVRGLADDRVRLIRQPTPISVTSNWNCAFREAGGEHFIMLGDDDALAPGFFERQDEIIGRFGNPDVVYFPAYHFAYPGVMPTEPGGYLSRVANSELFLSSPGPYLLSRNEASRLGRRGLRFRHDVSFNAQHFLYSTAWARSVAGDGEFYKSVYPDYYSCLRTFLLEPNLVVDTREGTVIGISKKSYGFYHFNDREEAGAALFLTTSDDAKGVSQATPSECAALELPGDAHMRRWLLAAIAVAHSPGVTGDVDLRRYRRIQGVNTAVAAASGRVSRQTFRSLASALPEREARLAQRAFDVLNGIERLTRAGRDEAAGRLSTALNIYSPAQVDRLSVEGLDDIGQAVDFLEGIGLNPNIQADAALRDMQRTFEFLEKRQALLEQRLIESQEASVNSIALAQEFKTALGESEAEMLLLRKALSLSREELQRSTSAFEEAQAQMTRLRHEFDALQSANMELCAEKKSLEQDVFAPSMLISMRRVLRLRAVRKREPRPLAPSHP